MYGLYDDWIYFNVNRQILHRIIDILYKKAHLRYLNNWANIAGNYIYPHEAIELLNIWAILGNYETISKFNKNET